MICNCEIIRLNSTAVVTEDVDAMAPDDYTPRTITDVVTFQASEREKTITIDIKDDYIKENSECFKVKLMQPTQLLYQALDICTPEAQVQIKDDDGKWPILIAGWLKIEWIYQRSRDPET